MLSYASSIVSFLVEPARCVNRNAPPLTSDGVPFTQAPLSGTSTALSWLTSATNWTLPTPAPFGSTAAPCLRYTGLSWDTFVQNLNSMLLLVCLMCWMFILKVSNRIMRAVRHANRITHGPNVGAYTSDVSTGTDMGFMLVFGVLFSSLTGALSGANNSGAPIETAWESTCVFLFYKRSIFVLLYHICQL